MRDRTLKWLLVLPAVLVVAATALWPLAYSASLSLRQWRLSRSPRPQGWVGTENYEMAFSSGDFLNAVLNTVLFVGLTVGLTTLLALGLALLLSRGGPLRRSVQALLILPFAMSPALVGVSWRFMFHPEFGLFAALFGTLIPPLAGVNWLASPTLAFAALVMADVWAWTPFMTLILIGGLASVPRDTIEAAQVDGSPSWRVVLEIVVPQLRPVLAVVVILKTVFSLKAFDVIFMLTQGGPGQATETLVYQAYLNGFKYYDMGYAAAIAWVMVVPMLALTVLYTRFVFRRA
ncbi:sugar ABC transporter permease (plasmid) [Roseomonas sp. OT10]|uniref:carbohydrate ABC transporter permease n=1 Tax=Roseomonas cutis TaxID=2897332 RepID=UPI001E3699E5|nr:sugar ABC transporter permease [Roseomonas sp. OT10]UFN51650.1 sugar ABC transporter permease [Roseomonas sp. OT10]